MIWNQFTTKVVVLDAHDQEVFDLSLAAPLFLEAQRSIVVHIRWSNAPHGPMALTDGLLVHLKAFQAKVLRVDKYRNAPLAHVSMCG